MRDQSVADLIQDPEVQNCFVWCCLKQYYKDCTFDPLLESHTTSEEARELADGKGEITPLKIFNKYFIKDPEGMIDRDEVLRFFQDRSQDPNYTKSKLRRFLKTQGIELADIRSRKESSPSGFVFKRMSYLNIEDKIEEDTHNYLDDCRL
jgi:hypothetical protein